MDILVYAINLAEPVKYMTLKFPKRRMLFIIRTLQIATSVLTYKVTVTKSAVVKSGISQQSGTGKPIFMKAESIPMWMIWDWRAHSEGFARDYIQRDTHETKIP